MGSQYGHAKLEDIQKETTGQVHLHSPLSPAQEHAFETIIPTVSTYHIGSHQGGVLGHMCDMSNGPCKYRHKH